MNSVILRFVLSLFTYFSPVTTILLTILVIYYIAFKWRRRRMEYLLNKLPGPLALPIIGNALEISTGYDGKMTKYQLWCISIHFHSFNDSKKSSQKSKNGNSEFRNQKNKSFNSKNQNDHKQWSTIQICHQNFIVLAFTSYFVSSIELCATWLALNNS